MSSVLSYEHTTDKNMGTELESGPLKPLRQPYVQTKQE